MNKRLCLSSTHDKKRGNSSIPRPPFTPERQTRPNHHHDSLQLVYVDRNHSYKYEGRKVSQWNNTDNLPTRLYFHRGGHINLLAVENKARKSIHV